MLKVNYGVIGGKGFVALELEGGDLEVIKELKKSSTSFKASNGCGLNYSDITNGKICLPCSEKEFELIEVAVNEFNAKYLPNDSEEVSNLRAEIKGLKEEYETVLSNMEKEIEGLRNENADLIEKLAKIKGLV